MRTSLLVTLIAVLSAVPVSSAPRIVQVHGRCTGCAYPYRLSHFQFVSATEGWATGYAVFVSRNHVSEYGTVLHTTDGGRTWTQLRDVETYGIEVEPTFSFVNAREGWIGWSTASDPLVHLIRTTDGGLTWQDLHPREELFSLRNLTFVSSAIGYALVDERSVATTTDAGETWSIRDIPPSHAGSATLMRFQTAETAWITGEQSVGSELRPMVFRMEDSGATWRGAELPNRLQGEATDLFVLDADHGWLSVWNRFIPVGGSESATRSSLLKTVDGGLTWAEEVTWQRAASVHRALRSVKFLSPSVGVIAVGGSVLTTTDGGLTWNQAHRSRREIQSCEIVMGAVWCVAGTDILKIALPR